MLRHQTQGKYCNLNNSAYNTELVQPTKTAKPYLTTAYN